MLLLSVIIIISLTASIILWMRKKNQYWIERGVPQGKPVLLFGHQFKNILRQIPVPELVQSWYNIDKDARFVGLYQFFQPFLFLRDPDVIRDVWVKHFDHFTNRRGIIPEDAEPFLAKTLFSLGGKPWRDMRSTLSPVFTSSKMKFMFSLIDKTGQQFVNHFLKDGEEVISLDMMDTLRRFASDIIANVAFGIQNDSLEEQDNEFFTMGNEALNFKSVSKILKFFMANLAPRLYKFFGLRLLSLKLENFFTNIVRENIECREKQGIIRPDLIQLLMEARKHGLQHDESLNFPEAGFATIEESEIGKTKKGKIDISNEDITAQAFLFFVAGFDTAALSMCFLSHELAVNPEIQEKLRREVDATLRKCNNTLTYEDLLSMKYMDMVVSESLRKWTIGIATDRICTKPFTIEPKLPNEKRFTIEKNMAVVLPMYAIHRDPKYYPDPERFDPERFNDENKKNIKPYTYLPFGVGPRACIGTRLALLEIKTLFCYLLARFELVPIEKTQIPIKFSKRALNMVVENGFWLGLKRR